MKIQRVNFYTRQIEGMVQGIKYLTNAGNTPDGSIAGCYLHAQLCGSNTIKRNATASSIKDEIEGILKIIQCSP